MPTKLAQSKIHKVYNLQEVLTEDVTGTIYSAKTRLHGEEVAINILAPDCSIVSQQLIKIEHPNICKAHKVLKMQDGTLAIVIEKPTGKPILDFMWENLPANQLAPGQAISAILQLLSALHAIHNTGKTARNLSVNNIFLYKDHNNNLKLKLVSLGIGGTGINMKAPHYLSPERIMNVDKGDPLADIWAAGAVFYHLCFGQPPFSGKDAVEVAKKNMLEDPSFEKKGREIPDELVAIIKRAIQRDESKRYQNVSEMVGELLPLREIYKEPMSEEVKSALKNSYPPPPPPKEMLAPRKPTRDDITGLQALHRAEHKKERKDPTAEYGTKKKKKTPPPMAAVPKRFPDAEISAKKPVIAPKKPVAGPMPMNPNRTLLGMPAVTAAEIKRAEEKKAGTSPTNRQAEKKAWEEQPKKQDSLFSPRSILGSEEDIKKLEAEMDFLEDREDGDVPTLVASEKNLAALMGKIAEFDNSASSSRAAQPPTAPVHKQKTLPIPTDAPSMPSASRNEQGPPSETGGGIGALFASVAEHNKPDEAHSSVIPNTALDATAIASPLIETPPVEEPAAPKMYIPSDISESEVGETTKEPKQDLRHIIDSIVKRVIIVLKPRKQLLIFAGVGVAAVIAFIIGIISVTADDVNETNTDAPPAETSLKASPTAAESVTEIEVKTAELAEPANSRETAASAEKAPKMEDRKEETGKAETVSPQPEYVSINFLNIPKNYTAKIDGNPTSIPIEAEKTQKISTVIIKAEGYEPFKIRVVPDRDREIPIQMKKAPEKTKKKKKPGGSKSKNNNDSLVSNPFKK